MAGCLLSCHFPENGWAEEGTDQLAISQAGIAPYLVRDPGQEQLKDSGKELM